MIGIICATDEELRAVRALGEEAAPPRVIAGEPFYRLRFSEGLAVAATRTEIGKVNAALAATLMLCHPALMVRALVVVGVAGGLRDDLAPGDTVIATEVACHDYGAICEGVMRAVKPGAFPLGAPPARPEPMSDEERRIVQLLLARPQVRASADAPGRRLRPGCVVSGDLFINSGELRAGLRERFGADVVDMESYAVFQVARRFAAPVVILRSVSDDAGEGADAQYLDGLPHTCDCAASFLPMLLEIMTSGEAAA